MSEEIKEVKIAIPEGYEIDEEKSTFTNIVFKKCTSWFEHLKQRCEDVYIAGYMMSETFVRNCFKNPFDICIFATKKQAKRAKAYAIITQIIKNDGRFGGEITDEEWENPTVKKYAISRCNGHLDTENLSHVYSPIAFHTKEQRDLFLTENVQILYDYFMID